MKRPFNLANLLVVLGLGVLVASFFVPSWTARRVARVEDRARDVAQALLETARRLAPMDLADPEQRQRLTESLREACRERGQPASDLPESIPDQAAPTFGNRHYLFRLLREPAPQPAPPDFDPDARRPFEVYAWPRTLAPPGRSTFFLPERGRPAYTRNMTVGYRDLDRAPNPGDGQPREATHEHQLSYRSRSDERWLFLP
jgi:hypothetical protein